MTRRLAVASVVVAVALAGVIGAHTGIEDDKQFQAALQQEMVVGDLRGAIEAYRAIVERPGVDRALAAAALMRMGESYQKLGDSRARDVFAQVVARFGDQAVAADARAKLDATGGAPASQVGTTKTVWSGPKVSNGGVVSRDGRWLPYTNWDTGNLMLHDLVNDRDSALTDGGRFPPQFPVSQQQYADHSRVSPDGRRVAFGWFNSERYEVRVVDIEPAGAQPRTIFHNPDVEYIQPFDWSPDGRSLVVQLRRGDNSGQIGLLRVADGVLTPLKSFDWRAATSHAAFSPDGRHIGYDLPGQAPLGDRDVFVIAVDGSREVRLTTHARDDRMVGWSRDGTRVLFASDRTGSRQIWVQHWSGQSVAGDPQVVPSSFSGEAVGFAADESLYERKTTYAGSLFRTVSFDFQLGRATSVPADPGEEFFSTNLRAQAEWSTDGRRLALARRDRAEVMGMLVSIVDLDSRRVTNVRPHLVSPGDRLVWAPDGQSFLTAGMDLKQRRGLFRIGIDSGEVTLLEGSADRQGRNVGIGLAVSPDGAEIYVRRANQEAIDIVARNLSSGAERELASWPRPSSGINDYVGRPSLSPDGRLIATVMSHSATEASVLLIAPGSGEMRTLRRGAAAAPEVLMWAPDNRSVFVRWTAPGRTPAEPEVWRIPVAGGAPVRIDWTLGHDNREFRVHPDGRRLVYVVNTSSSQTEVRVLTGLLSRVGR
jgi:Tol biopolymer transport system component